MPKTVYVLNGPNLNLLGTREPELYGRATLGDVEKLCRATAKRHGLAVVFRQSNHEGEIVDWIQEARAKKAVGHITNIHRREPFRHRSYISKAARAVICGCGVDGYALAITGIANMINAKE